MAVLGSTYIHGDLNVLGTGGNIALKSDIPANSTSATGNTLVMRDANGDINGRYITGTWLKSTGATEIGNSWADVWVNDGNGWLYRRSKANFKSDLGIAIGIQYYGSNETSNSPSQLYSLCPGSSNLYLIIPGKSNDYINCYYDSYATGKISYPVIIKGVDTTSEGRLIYGIGNSTTASVSTNKIANCYTFKITSFY